jgi:hypothetical protein
MIYVVSGPLTCVVAILGCCAHLYLLLLNMHVYVVSYLTASFYAAAQPHIGLPLILSPPP